MGLLDGIGGIAGTAVNALSDIKNGKAAIERYKTGKTEEQKLIIDYFTSGLAGCANGGKIFSKMKMEDYEQKLSKRLSALNLKQRAIEMIGLDESEIIEIPPIMLGGYVWDDFNTRDLDDVVLVRSENQHAVSSRFSITWLFFSQTQMYCHKYTFDMISDRSWEQTMDFFYQDISCFTIRRNLVQKVMDKGTQGCLSSQPYRECNSYYVDSLDIVVPGASYTFSMRNSTKVSQSLHAAKAMVRERKYVH